ncbi:hypothetical protein [Prosthecobacter sp.]|uniref:hypothetical protein n=1 Tax=Prosthecobacter sp. TaxID=1965333 RepID=UPI002486EF73|nr:hypothetical protein [Prosthecobacter sp.]MDI1313274.1 hypothetical protein [Prosthecobacter sp.]
MTRQPWKITRPSFGLAHLAGIALTPVSKGLLPSQNPKLAFFNSGTLLLMAANKECFSRRLFDLQNTLRKGSLINL